MAEDTDGKNGRRVLIGLSGGVDSAVAAWILKDEGYRVEGLYLHNGFPLRSEKDAVNVAEKLGIPLHQRDVSSPFEKTIIRYFTEEYRAGRTPNPCIRCNREIKIPALRDEADRRGMPWIATGHYARTERLETGETALLKGKDKKKDQSYFLFEVKDGDLFRLLFPLGNLMKEEVRALGKRLELPVSEKESQEICFIPDDDYVSFLNSRPSDDPFLPGPIRDREGRTLGRHRGIHTVTVGQRRGLGIASERPYYVLSIDPSAREVLVGREEDQFSRGLVARGVTLRGGVKGNRRVFEGSVKIRYRHPGVPSTVELMNEEESPVSARVLFHRPQKAVAPGQAAVFYDGDRILGGGWIERGFGEA